MKLLSVIFCLLMALNANAEKIKVSVDLNLYDLDRAGVITADEDHENWIVEIKNTDILHVLYSAKRKVKAYSTGWEFGFLGDTPIPGVFHVVKSTGKIKFSRIIHIPESGMNFSVVLINKDLGKRYTLVEESIDNSNGDAKYKIASSHGFSMRDPSTVKVSKVSSVKQGEEE